MKFYKAYQPIKAISFDLDDTLYNNQPIILNAEQALHQHLVNTYPELKNISKCDLSSAKQFATLKRPELQNDVTLLRKAWLAYLFQKHDITYSDSDIDSAFAIFMQARNQIVISKEFQDTLIALSEHFTLVVISNGNVDFDRLAISRLFKLKLFANTQNKAKPEQDMFNKIASALNLPVQQILHIGDNLETDIFGANRAGMQSCWYNPFNSKTNYPALPHMQINALADLLKLRP
ncbi:HAD-IA family hydrolase [Algibacillus agarilyticus]|uniref:HAD-IA family hydrolase n=1 Tax=Algibacillus agarilyticus TaxID=2234133 RepID=UPI000DD046D0|nr:HAD-IA family hydrolase [Algibacillus agarilyticus]